MSALMNVLALIVSLTGLTVAQDLMITPTGTTHTRPLTGSILFTCSVTGLSSPEINPNLKWFDRNSNEITQRTGSRLYVEDDGPQSLKLYITSIEAGDAGTYSCQGTVEGNRLDEAVELAIFKDITFDHAPTPQHPAINTVALIECRVSGQPTPQVSWRYRGQRIIMGDRYSQDQAGLRIRNITREDDGRYLCRGEVPADGRYDERGIDVVVHIPPKITMPPDNQEGIEGHEVSLSCRASGLPNPKYAFYKDNNDNPVPSTERVEVDGNAGNIHFRPIEKGDEGDYKCVATNDVGQDEATGHLRVLVRPNIYELRNVSQTEGLQTTLVCKSRGDPDPLMTWRKVGNPFDFEDGDNEGGRINVQKQGAGELHLKIKNLSPSDTSNYTCTSTNTAGRSERNGTVIVNFRPRFDSEHNRVVYNWAGKTRNISCHAQGEPLPAVEWWRFNYRIRDNETFRVYDMGRNSNLQVTVRELDQEWVYGFYTCRARNSLGERDLEIDMKRAEVPDAPKSVTSKESSPTTVVLAVVPPDNNGGVNIIGYRVEFDKQSSDFAIENNTNDNNGNNHKPISIENLKPSTTYIFRVRARNEVGVGPAMEYSHTTESIRKPYPIEITSDPVGLYPYEYTIHWAIPRTGGIPIKEYRFRWREVTVGSDNSVETPVTDWSERRVADDENAPLRHYRLDLLRPLTDYEVIITARNDIDWSDAHPRFTFKTAKATDAPIGAVGGASEVVLSKMMAFVVVLSALSTRYL